MFAEQKRAEKNSSVDHRLGNGQPCDTVAAAQQQVCHSSVEHTHHDINHVLKVVHLKTIHQTGEYIVWKNEEDVNAKDDQNPPYRLSASFIGNQVFDEVWQHQPAKHCNRKSYPQKKEQSVDDNLIQTKGVLGAVMHGDQFNNCSLHPHLKNPSVTDKGQDEHPQTVRGLPQLPYDERGEEEGHNYVGAIPEKVGKCVDRDATMDSF